MGALRVSLPDVLTLCGLMSGLYGLVAVWERDFERGFYAVCVAAVFDVLDGAVARALGISSERGKMLDSLADLVCFGVLPALWLYVFVFDLDASAGVWAYGALLVVPVVALRLVFFMLSAESGHFSGLPCPGAALFLTSICFLPESLWGSAPAWGLLLVSGLVSFLMLYPLPCVSMKFTHYRWKTNELRYLLIAVGIGSAFVLHQRLFLVLIPVYVALALYLYIKNLFKWSARL